MYRPVPKSKQTRPPLLGRSPMHEADGTPIWQSGRTSTLERCQSFVSSHPPSIHPMLVWSFSLQTFCPGRFASPPTHGVLRIPLALFPGLRCSGRPCSLLRRLRPALSCSLLGLLL